MSLSPETRDRLVEKMREAYRRAVDQVQYFGASEDGIPAPMEAALAVVLDDPQVTITGADQIAARVGREFGWTVRAFPNWKQHGKAAGPIRNRLMLDEQPDLVLAFQVDGSPGTQDTVDEARRRGIRTWVIEGEPEGYA